MSPAGEVPRKDFLRVLEAHGCTVPRDSGEEWLQVLLVDKTGTVIERARYPQRVPRKTLLHRVSRKLEIPIHFFFHPEMITAPGETIH